MSGVSEAAVEAARASVPRGLPGTNIHEWLVKYVIPDALEAAHPAIRADIAAEVLAPIEALIETDGVFLKKDTKIKRVQEDRRRDLGAIVTTSMVTVDDLRAALSTAKETP